MGWINLFSCLTNEWEKIKKDCPGLSKLSISFFYCMKNVNVFSS